MSIAIPLHILAAVIWVGGMFFAYMVLRPVAADMLPPEQRLPLWCEVFKLFFVWVWAAIITLLVTGIWMIVLLGGMGGVDGVGVHVHIMLLVGVFMMLIFMHVFFNSFKKLKWSVAEHDWISGRNALTQIRKLVLLNLILGLLVSIIGSSGRYWLG
ncbi:CopD family protein [Methylophaga sp. OBS4]|uniref:CopD family protein n=1 Tax=Methylophaga sp. OBS4 TaxID=2991935 RepID=UPI002259BF99|nr:CopD family protein [Methylophaga sp. OBS4]MCX4187841.1 CopD family protein [Methylophaga sp. OBS4]